MRRPRLPSVEELCARASRVAVLEGIVDPTNVGAIFRSAAALHMDAVLVTPTCCDPLSRRAVRVSMGTLFQIPWTFLGTDASQWPQPGLERLKELGFQTAAMALDSTALSIEDPRLRAAEKLAILLGTEGDGLAPRTIAQCDFTVCIPMARGVDSLNVAAASAVAFGSSGPGSVPIVWKTADRLAVRRFPACEKSLAEFAPAGANPSSDLFSPATRASGKTLLRLQVWGLPAAGGQTLRAADCCFLANVAQPLLRQSQKRRTVWRSAVFLI